MTVSEGVKPVDHGNLNVWVRSLLVNLKTNVQNQPALNKSGPRMLCKYYGVNQRTGKINGLGSQWYISQNETTDGATSFFKILKHNIVAARFRDVHTDVKGLGSFNPDVTTSSAILPTIFY